MVLTPETISWSGTIRIHSVDHKHVAVIEVETIEEDPLNLRAGSTEPECITEFVLTGLPHALTDICKQLDETFGQEEKPKRRKAA